MLRDGLVTVERLMRGLEYRYLIRIRNIMELKNDIQFNNIP